MLLAFRVVEEDHHAFLAWANAKGLEHIAVMPADEKTVVSLFKTNDQLSDQDLLKSGLRAKRLNLPRYNIEVDDLDMLELLRKGASGPSLGEETVKEFIESVLSQSRPVTVHTKSDNQIYVIYPSSPHGWTYRAV